MQRQEAERKQEEAEAKLRTECCICLEEFNDAEQRRVVLKACGHVLCCECAQDPDLTECPVCRKASEGWVPIMDSSNVPSASGSNAVAERDLCAELGG